VTDKKISQLVDGAPAQLADVLAAVRAGGNVKLSLQAIKDLLALADGSVALSKLADIATGKVLGNVSGDPAAPAELSGTQVTALLDAFVGEGGSAAKGLVPSPGTVASFSRALKADGLWTPDTSPIIVTPVGSYQQAHGYVQGAIGWPANTSGCFATALFIPIEMTFDMVIQDLATPQSGGKCRCCIADWNGGWPASATILFDLGELDLSAGGTNVYVSSLLTNSPLGQDLTLSPGWYWMLTYTPSLTTAPSSLSCTFTPGFAMRRANAAMNNAVNRGPSATSVTYPTSSPATAPSGFGLGNIACPTFLLRRSA
jgi:hypothetical protein